MVANLYQRPVCPYNIICPLNPPPIVILYKKINFNNRSNWTVRTHHQYVKKNNEGSVMAN